MSFLLSANSSSGVVVLAEFRQHYCCVLQLVRVVYANDCVQLSLLMSSDDVRLAAAEADALFRQHAGDDVTAALIDSQALSAICTAAFAHCERTAALRSRSLADTQVHYEKSVV